MDGNQFSFGQHPGSKTLSLLGQSPLGGMPLTSITGIKVGSWPWLCRFLLYRKKGEILGVLIGLHGHGGGLLSLAFLGNTPLGFENLSCRRPVAACLCRE
jgi:hypothetical protein